MRMLRACLAGVAVVLGTSGAAAFEFFDGRLEVHGFFETQVRTIARDLDLNDGWDLTQWYNILNIEAEADFAPDGFGPFDVLQGFVRLEGRYDCVWRSACGLSSSVDTYGNRVGRSPKRLGQGRRAGFRSSGNVFNGEQRALRDIAREFLPFQFSRVDPTDATSLGAGNGSLEPSRFFNIQGIDTLYDNRGVDGVFGNADDPAPFYFSRQEADCLFNFRSTRGSQNGVGNQILLWNPDCQVRELAALAGKPDPLSTQDKSPILALTPLGVPNLIPCDPASPAAGATGCGSGLLPLRPRAMNVATSPLDGSPLPLRNPAESQGVYFPNGNLANLIRKGEFRNPQQNFSQDELAWNQGDAQEDELFVKEAYLDLEFFDSRLWVRAGRQQIVWGKTELFRNQDLWNPQDLALASLPSLEESRIPLWSARGVWSFYEVGPFEDVRLEVAAVYDEFQPTDIGRCGEPYTPNPACNKTLGLFIHGLTGFGIAGEVRPEEPWHDSSSIEVGARIEWRWERFSFALTEYYGFTDLFFQDEIFRYSRNVDPVTGRPRAGMSTGSCADSVFSDGPPGSRFTPGSITNPNCLTPDNALTQHSVNQQLFRMICATSIGFQDLDPTACGQSVFNSQSSPTGTPGAPNPFPILTPTVASLVGNFLAGNRETEAIAGILGGAAFFDTLVELNVDPCDGFLTDCTTPAQDNFDASGAMVAYPSGTAGVQFDVNTPNFDFLTNPGSPGVSFPTLNLVLSQQQKALLGCGEFYGTNCELDGIDLMNAEVSVLMQSWIGIEGTGVSGENSGDTFAALAQPGTINFVPSRGPLATRPVGAGIVMLPGSRGANDRSDVFDDDPGYDPFIDGCSGPLGAAAAALTPGCNAGDPVPARADQGLASADANGDGLRDAAARALQHPFAGRDFGPDTIFGTVDDFFRPGEEQFFANELAALSFNFMMVTVAFSQPDGAPTLADLVTSDAFRTDGCSFRAVQFCSSFQALFQVTGVQRNVTRAGGNGRFGRRDFVWHGGRDIALRYEKRNVLGFSADFAEDRTKSNWSIEFTWQDDLTFADNDSVNGVETGVDTYNLTVSVDRPTFINFLNENRTFFINSQVFMQYVDGYRKGFQRSGPWNFLGVLILTTGYFDDRLLPRMTLVYDKRSNSGAFIPQVTYRFSSDFSATFGLALFTGREERRDMALSPTSLSNRVGRNAYNDFVENGISAVRERDEVFLRLRYSF